MYVHEFAVKIRYVEQLITVGINLKQNGFIAGVGVDYYSGIRGTPGLSPPLQSSAPLFSVYPSFITTGQLKYNSRLINSKMHKYPLLFICLSLLLARADTGCVFRGRKKELGDQWRIEECDVYRCTHKGVEYRKLCLESFRTLPPT
ncbi:hypothetical protein Btru_064401 [Bulinus truncatus]|nr:hypothetical protein Btru_064401 [Bulinus truncatus]